MNDITELHRFAFVRETLKILCNSLEMKKISIFSLLNDGQEFKNEICIPRDVTYKVVTANEFFQNVLIDLIF